MKKDEVAKASQFKVSIQTTFAKEVFAIKEK
jgi:hypothetical protein